MGNIIYTILDIIIYNILSVPLILRMLCHKRLDRMRTSKILIWLFCFLFCVQARYSGDWYHYKEFVQYFHSGYWTISSVEPVYQKLVFLLRGNYVAFRVVIWGFALLFLYRLLKRLKIYNNVTLTIFVIWELYMYAYPRVSLGLSLFFWGYSFLITKLETENAVVNVVKGLCLVILSCVFHKSILILILILPFSFINYNRKMVIMLILFFSLFVTVAGHYINFIIANFENVGGVEHLTGEMAYTASLGYRLSGLLIKSPIFLILFSFVYKYSICGNSKNVSYVSQRLFSFCFCIMACALIFKSLQLASSVLYSRTLYMIFIPLVCLISNNLLTFRNHRAIVFCTILSYLGYNYSLLYCLLGHFNGSIQ